MKTLIISHIPICTHQNMGKTFLSLFSDFEKDNLCQLYIYPTVPDIDTCSSYYRITDKDVLKSYYKFKVQGKEIEADARCRKLFENAKDEGIYRNRKNKKSIRILARDLLWSGAHWFNKDLKNWLDREKPGCIFVAPGTGKFLYNIATKTSKYLNIPIITYICDDYYFVKKETTFLGKVQQKLLHNKIEKLINNSAYIVNICDELKDAYYGYFRVPSCTIMTGTNYEISENVKADKLPQNLTYFGNIRCNRYTSLVEIGIALDEINAEQGTDYKLNIYTGENDKSILDCFNNIESVNLCGFVTGDEFEKAFRRAELLLHTEAFDEKSIDFVKRSVSTKIADTMASGIPMFAYGPDCVSSMKHLIRNSSAICATDKAQLKEKLKLAFSDIDLLHEVALNGLSVAHKHHDSTVAGQKIEQVITEVTNEGSSHKLCV